ncbi:MAG: hypothetical protein ABSG14_09485 [Verrucomicrobiia bacterium]|jgi:hypothetical protein
MINATQATPLGGFVVNWTSVPGSVYQVLYRSNANSPWQTIGGVVAAAVNQVSMTCTDTTASAVSSRPYCTQNPGQ